MSIENVRVCKCDICGKVLLKETGHLRWQTNIRFGSNIDAGDGRMYYDDVCDECVNAIRNVIQERSNKKETQCEDRVNSFTDYL